MSMKVAIGSALPCEPGALHHNNPIPDGYARVTVEEIVPGFEDWRLTLLHPKGREDLEVSSASSFYGKRSLSSFQARRQGKQVHPPVVVGGGGGGGGSPTPPSRRRRPPFTSAGADAAPILVRRVIGRRPQSTSGEEKQSWVINPDPYVPRTTKAEPSLKPLIPRPWELSVEENARPWLLSMRNGSGLQEEREASPSQQALAFKRNQELAEKQEKKALEEAEKKLEILVHDSLNMDAALWADMRKMMQNRPFISPRHAASSRHASPSLFHARPHSSFVTGMPPRRRRSSGFRSVRARPNNRFYAELHAGGFRLTLGMYDSLELAVAWRFRRSRCDLKFPDVESLAEAEFLTPAPCLIDEEDRRRHR
ncbi:hypothetical protein QYE76_027301 [Lolium multiflorum]|uniref:DUF8039 domain-containing protein n=1 Tax=Lolium multiflorum TaxID=4521 RepID=A0AAD8QMD2_LOLMU|nr:hypothetical protein QYE76_027301 [Lolium multiflorum]